MSVLERIRIVVLGTESDVWCTWCNVPSATSITYLLERDDLPVAVRRLVYCDGCGEEATRR